MKKLNMTNKIMIAMILGMAAGLIIGPAIGPIKVVGDIFLRLIQMSVVVLIMGAVIEAVGSLDPKELGKLGGKIFAWFMGLTALAAALGIGLGYIVKPGAGLNMDMGTTTITASQQTLSEMIVGFFPTNIIDAMAKANMIQAIIFSILFGLSLSVIGKQDKDNVVLNFIRHFNVAILNVVKMVMNLAPIGIFALLAWVTGSIGVKVIIPLAKFLGSMAIGTVIYMIFLILISAAYAKVSPMRLAKHLWKMTVVCFHYDFFCYYSSN